MTEWVTTHGPEWDGLVSALDNGIRVAYVEPQASQLVRQVNVDNVSLEILDLLDLCLDDADKDEVRAEVERILDQYGIRHLEVEVWGRVAEMRENPVRGREDDLFWDGGDFGFREALRDFLDGGPVERPKITLEMFPGAREGDVLLRGVVGTDEFDGRVTFLDFDSERTDFQDEGLFSGLEGQVVEVMLLGGNLCVVPVKTTEGRVELPHLTTVTVEASGLGDRKVTVLMDRLFSAGVGFSASVVGGGVCFEIELPPDEAAEFLAE